MVSTFWNTRIISLPIFDLEELCRTKEAIANAAIDSGPKATHLQIMPLHMTKIAYRSESPATLRQWLESHIGDSKTDGEARLTTRYLPKRHEEMVGGSLYWIHSKKIIGRSPIKGFMDNGEGRQWIRLEPKLIAVQPVPRRAHQGWRYLEDKDAPLDLGKDAEGAEEIPAEILGELADLGLV